MYKKLIYLVSLVVVLSLTAGVTRADLRHHWTLNGDLADVIDSVNLSAGAGQPAYGEGRTGGGVEFDGTDDYLYTPLAPFMPSQTVCVWVKTSNSGQSVLGWSDGHPTHGTMDRNIYFNADGTVTFRIWTGQTTIVTSNGPVNDGEWHHLAVGYTEGEQMWLYVDGVFESSTDSSNIWNSYNTPYFTAGIESMVSTYFTGAIDDIRIYDEALTQDQILSAMTAQPFPFAFGPDPAHGALYSDTWITLSWRAGDFAVSHDVYLGDNFADVNDGTGDTFRSNQATTYFVAGFPGFPYPDGLVPGTTYYWRIDEVNDLDPNSPWKGNVWSFMVPPRTAYDPAPANGAKFISTDTTLSWTAGFNAKLHAVYFGDDFDTVSNATGGTPMATTTYTPAPLELDKNYYWRVDEFDGFATHKGDIWSFKTLPDIPIVDPNLMCWWKLDETSGTTALDWSGHGHHGTFQGDPLWVDGYDGGALEFDGVDDYVEIPYTTDPTTYTITVWVKPARTGPANIVVRTSPSGPTVHWSHQLRIDSSGAFEHYAWDGSECRVMGTTAVKADTWYSVAAVATDNGRMRLYVNGQEEGIATNVGALWADGDRFLVGSNSGHGMGWFEGLIDDIRIYDYVLSQAEIQQAMRGDTSLAWNPSPTNGSTLSIKDATPLSWSPGDNAAQHDVYFGTDKDAVTDADTSDTSGIYRGRQVAASYTVTEGLEWGGGPYYWRVDEYNTDGTVTTGRVWSFMIADYLTVDDFEAYNDLNPEDPESNRIFLTWIDGYEQPTNGSTVGYFDPPFCEQTIVHSGRQSMPLFYDNSGPAYYSEATLPLTYPRDWTEEGVGVLTLWFYGDPANVAESMYVAVANATGPTAVVYHDNPDAALIDDWTQWNIDLEEISNQGVVLTNVDRLAIGFGNRNNPQLGGSGLMFIDDIRLYRPATEP